MKIIIKKDKATTSKIVADLIAELIVANPELKLGLATGSSPELVYQNLIQKKLDWKKIQTFNLDEYVGLKTNHKNSYRYFMHSKLFKFINIDEKNIHFPKNEGNFHENGLLYDQLISSVGNLDLQILGIGQNGHIAFNEPGTSFDQPSGLVDLSASTINANARMFNSMEEVPKQAVSMGLKTILQAKKIFLLAFGDLKAEAIKKAFQEKVSEQVPASCLQNHIDVTVFLDSAAAKLVDLSQIKDLDV